MLRLFTPLLPLLACVGLLLFPHPLPELVERSLPWLPIGLAGCTILLGYYFHSARLALGAMLVLLLEYGPQEPLWGIGLLLLLASSALLKERGLFSVPGILRLLVAGTVLGYLYWGQTQWPLPLAISQNLQWLLAGISALAVLLIWLRRDLAGLMLLVATASLWYRAEPLWYAAVQLSLLLALLVNTYAMAFVDQLTGIPGRRALEGRLSGLGRKYCVAMLDVDHFKKFNDTYGHDVGDQVLKLVAKKVSQVRGGGQAFRYGGEEFAIIFSRKASEQVLDHLEDVRESLADYPLRIRSNSRPNKNKTGKQARGASQNSKKTVQITISIGVAERTRERKQPGDVLKAADQALYKAKRSGRNCVVSAD